jgi:hypothetical protein
MPMLYMCFEVRYCLKDFRTAFDTLKSGMVSLEFVSKPGMAGVKESVSTGTVVRCAAVGMQILIYVASEANQ